MNSVGLDAKVTGSHDRTQIGTKGKVIRETKNLLFLDDKGTKKRVVKKDQLSSSAKERTVMSSMAKR